MEASKQSPMKIGLAFSGGGFRAAFFHVGVLARLAEFGILPHVEVLSTVSGGSIVGALYYLHVKKLLDANPNPKPDEFVPIIKKVETQLFAGVKKNLRMRTFLNPLKTTWMLASEKYSRTTRMGELYEQQLYREIWQEVVDAGGAKTSDDRILLKALLINPSAQRIKLDKFNKQAAVSAKIPDLVLNATSLNAGRYWRFSVTKIGETLADHEIRLRLREHDPCRAVTDAEVEKARENHYYRFEKNHYDNPVVPKAVADKLYLGTAVGASSAVPGVFAPVAITGLYDSETPMSDANQIIELVDGGVYDNQGLDHVHRAQCSYIIASDGSGPLFAEANPTSQLLGVLSRANSVMMARIRSDNIEELRLRLDCWRDGTTKPCQPPLVEEAAFFHLRQEPCPKGPFSLEQVDALAHIRTDLDSFSEIEASSLMLHGYTLADSSLKTHCGKLVSAFTTQAPGQRPRDHWAFRAVETALANEKSSRRILRHLKVGQYQFFRLFRLWREPESWFAWAIVALLVLVAGSWIYRVAPTIDFADLWNRIGKWFGAALVLWVIGWLLGKIGLGKLWRRYTWIRKIRGLLGVFVVVSWVGSVVVALYLVTVNKLFLSAGRVNR